MFVYLTIILVQYLTSIKAKTDKNFFTSQLLSSSPAAAAVILISSSQKMK
jgi:hypothetical protein